jgi:hypothetical protein
MWISSTAKSGLAALPRPTLGGDSAREHIHEDRRPARLTECYAFLIQTGLSFANTSSDRHRDYAGP